MIDGVLFHNFRDVIPEISILTLYCGINMNENSCIFAFQQDLIKIRKRCAWYHLPPKEPQRQEDPIYLRMLASCPMHLAQKIYPSSPLQYVLLTESCSPSSPTGSPVRKNSHLHAGFVQKVERPTMPIFFLLSLNSVYCNNTAFKRSLLY